MTAETTQRGRDLDSVLDGLALTGVRRTSVTARLRCLDPLHIGGGEVDGGAEYGHPDSVVIRDRNNVPLIPGEALAGVMSASCEEIAPHFLRSREETPLLTASQLSAALFGSRIGDLEVAKGEVVTSALVVDHARLIDPVPSAEAKELSRQSVEWMSGIWKSKTDVTPAQRRFGNAIDRGTGVASDGKLFDRELLPVGIAFGLQLELETYCPGWATWRDERPGEDAAIVAERLNALLRAGLLRMLGLWRQRGLRLGGGVSGGLGRMALEEIEIRDIDLSQADQRLAYLRRQSGSSRGGGSSLAGSGISAWHGIGETKPLGEEPPVLAAPSYVDQGPETGGGERRSEDFVIELELRPREPVLIGRQVIDHEDRVRDRVICDERFIYRPDAPDGDRFGKETIFTGSTVRRRVRAQLEKLLRSAGVDEVDPSQTVADSKRKSAKDNEGWGGVQSLLEELSPLELLFGSPVLAGRVKFSDAIAGRGVDLDGDRSAPIAGDDPERAMTPITSTRDHIAQDRFLGGVDDTAKFERTPVTSGSFLTEIVIERAEPWHLAMLLIGLRELADGEIGIGRAFGAGYGRVEARLSSVRARTIPGSELDLQLTNAAGVELNAEAAGPLREHHLDLSIKRTDQDPHEPLAHEIDGSASGWLAEVLESDWWQRSVLCDRARSGEQT